MTDKEKHIEEAGPSTPVSVLGLDGAQAGDKFNVVEDEREAEYLSRHTTLQREQAVRTQRHITLDEIGRRDCS